ncbi:MAG: hypothetical protein JXQ73_00435 [Phycisphaerae bacterium]|nr:hypothetical protein [Phycisphaerae bacterium]
MYEIEAEQVYIAERAQADPLCVARMERMLPFIRADRVEVVSDARLNDLAAERGWQRTAGRRTGELRRNRKLTIVLNRFEWLDSESWWRRGERFPALTRFMLDGNGAWTLREGDRFAETMGSVCRRAWEMHCAYGCAHACAYCHVGDLLNIMLNLEELADRVERFVGERPGQQLYKFDNYTDTICFEPEYGASAVMVERFARFAADVTGPEAYLMLYTKSDNVAHLLDLDHRGRTIVNWSLSGQTQSALIERGAPPSGARIAAARQCQQAGYTVRFRLSPIVPVVDWREENRRLIERIFEHVRPDSVTIDVLGWMSARGLRGSIDLSLLDGAFREEVEAKLSAGDEDGGKYTFSHERRAEVMGFVVEEIRRHSRDVVIALCNETFAMWETLGPRLGQDPSDYHCCCGPHSVPGRM